MLKNIKEKFRKWLINLLKTLLLKLGYDYYSALADTPVRVEKVEQPLIIITAETTVDDYDLSRLPNDALIEEIHRRLATEIGKEAIKFAKFSRSFNHRTFSSTFKAEIRCADEKKNNFNCLF